MKHPITEVVKQVRQDGMLHIVPSYPISQVHISGSVQLPFTHEYLHTGSVQLSANLPTMCLTQQMESV